MPFRYTSSWLVAPPPSLCTLPSLKEGWSACPSSLQKTPQGWREVMVDRDLTAAEGEEVGKALRFVLAPGPTLASSNFSHLLPEGAEQGELCLEGMSLVTELAERVRDHGGGALIADYGETEIKKHTLRVRGGVLGGGEGVGLKWCTLNRVSSNTRLTTC